LDDQFVFDLQADMLAALANPKRLMIMKVLGKGEKTVGEIAAEVNIALQNTSQHLRLLKAHGIVVSRREGQTIYYRLATPIFAECCELVRNAIVDSVEKRRKALQATHK
jgi:ArsR family transcriptional regulator